MTIRTVASRIVISLAAALTTAAFSTNAAPAQSNAQVGALACDVSAGVGLILMQKQTMICQFTPANGGPPETYLGRIDELGVALGAVSQGRLVWGVVAPASGVPLGALSGTYTGVGAQASAGAGVGRTSSSAEPAAPSRCSRFPSRARPGSTSPEA